MKKINYLSLILTLALTVLAFTSVNAQDEFAPENKRANQGARPFKIMQELGLTPEQIQQIRAINRERKPFMKDAQQRWQTARRSLDAAIYADDSSDEQVKQLTKEAIAAQGEWLKERTLTEYLIRKVLTPEQLVKFRQLRAEQMERNREFKQENPNNEPPRRMNRFQQRKNPNRPQ
jgi:Spy/CpxP family protein refolding chaperone